MEIPETGAKVIGTGFVDSQVETTLSLGRWLCWCSHRGCSPARALCRYLTTSMQAGQPLVRTGVTHGIVVELLRHLFQDFQQHVIGINSFRLRLEI